MALLYSLNSFFVSKWRSELELLLQHFTHLFVVYENTAERVSIVADAAAG